MQQGCCPRSRAPQDGLSGHRDHAEILLHGPEKRNFGECRCSGPLRRRSPGQRRGQHGGALSWGSRWVRGQAGTRIRPAMSCYYWTKVQYLISPELLYSLWVAGKRCCNSRPAVCLGLDENRLSPRAGVHSGTAVGIWPELAFVRDGVSDDQLSRELAMFQLNGFFKASVVVLAVFLGLLWGAETADVKDKSTRGSVGALKRCAGIQALRFLK